MYMWHDLLLSQQRTARPHYFQHHDMCHVVPQTHVHRFRYGDIFKEYTSTLCCYNILLERNESFMLDGGCDGVVLVLGQAFWVISRRQFDTILCDVSVLYDYRLRNMRSSSLIVCSRPQITHNLSTSIVINEYAYVLVKIARRYFDYITKYVM